MRLRLLIIVLIGYCFDISSAGCCSCCNSCKRNNNGYGGGGVGSKGKESKKSKPNKKKKNHIGKSDLKGVPSFKNVGNLNPPNRGDGDESKGDNNVVDVKIFTNRVEIIVGKDVKKVEEITSEDVCEELVFLTHVLSSRVYKFESNDMIMNAKVTVDNEIKEKQYLIAIVSLKGDESTKYIVIVYGSGMDNLFRQCELKGVSLLSSNGITSMGSMFMGCKDITVCNINIDTSNVTDMSYMFYDCTSLQELKLGDKFNTSNVTNMAYMFSECESLTSLPDISKWNTSNVTNMGGMFSECCVKELDLSKFVFDKCTAGYPLNHFLNNSRIEKIKFGKSINSGKCVCDGIFTNCDDLQEVTFEEAPINDTLKEALGAAGLSPIDDSLTWGKVIRV